MPLVTTNLITARRQIKAFLNRPLNELNELIFLL